jgi:hypothetical protein
VRNHDKEVLAAPKLLNGLLEHRAHTLQQAHRHNTAAVTVMTTGQRVTGDEQRGALMERVTQ